MPPLLEKICRGIGPNHITAENGDVATFFSLLPPLPTRRPPGTHSESTAAIVERLALRVLCIIHCKGPAAETGPLGLDGQGRVGQVLSAESQSMAQFVLPLAH